MKTVLSLLLIVATTGAAAQETPAQPVDSGTEIRTVTFWQPDSRLDPDGEDSEAVADFFYYAESVSPILGKKSISVETVYADEFDVLTPSGHQRLDLTDITGCCAVVLSGHGAPIILKGVYTDVDLLEEIDRYFGSE